MVTPFHNTSKCNINQNGAANIPRGASKATYTTLPLTVRLLLRTYAPCRNEGKLPISAWTIITRPHLVCVNAWHMALWHEAAAYTVPLPAAPAGRQGVPSGCRAHMFPCPVLAPQLGLETSPMVLLSVSSQSRPKGNTPTPSPSLSAHGGSTVVAICGLARLDVW